MIITIHQPEHLPWLGFFNKLAKAELFVILDSVQFEKNYFQNRNRILGSNGVQWIGIPAVNQGHMEKTIATTEIASVSNPKWKEKYLNTVAQSYRKYPYFSEVFPILEQAIGLDTPYLAEINISIIKAFSEKLGFAPRFVRSTEMNVQGLKSDLILDICKAADATTYIAGPSGRDYLNMQSFADAGIAVVFNDYQHPTYPQRRTQEFVSHLSALDLFMNCGYAESRRIIMEGNEGTNAF
ncbi:MAG: WbqC family protein [Oscillospiraceae bacterium]|nr:WbqC family protein [Oscillospiraceae bacterium]